MRVTADSRRQPASQLDDGSHGKAAGNPRHGTVLSWAKPIVSKETKKKEKTKYRFLKNLFHLVLAALLIVTLAQSNINV